MNNYLGIELFEFEKKMNGYIMLFNYRISNLCVKAEPTAMLPVTVTLGAMEYNLEEVADAVKPDDYTFYVYPKNQNSLQDIVDGVFDMHPEFKMELATEKRSEDVEVRYIIYTMPFVNKDRRDLLNEATKTFHKECMANLEACNAKQLDMMAELALKLPPEDINEGKDRMKAIYDDAKEQADKLQEAKLAEIEEGYQRYLSEDDDRYNAPDTGDDNMEVSQDPEIDALFN